MNKQTFKTKLLVFIPLLGLMGVFTQCVPSNSKQVGSSAGKATSPYTAPKPTVKDEGQMISQAEVAEGVKNHEQILHTMSALTGVGITEGNLRNIYREAASSLPTSNDIKVYMSTHQLAATKLAAEFCHELVNNNNNNHRTNLWKMYNGFNAAPATGLSMSNRDLLIEEVLEAFWVVATDDEKNHAAEELHKLIDELLLNENLNDAATTRNVAKGVCTSVLASAHVILL